METCVTEGHMARVSSKVSSSVAARRAREASLVLGINYLWLVDGSMAHGLRTVPGKLDDLRARNRRT